MSDLSAFLFGMGLGVLYLLRHRTPFDTIWAIVKIVFTVIFAILLIGFVSNSVKSWWKK